MTNYLVTYNTVADEGHLYKVTFTTGPNSSKPTNYCHIFFKNNAELMAYAAKWEDEPPLYKWAIQSIVAVSQPEIEKE